MQNILSTNHELLEIINKLNELLLKLETQIPAAKLRFHTPLVARAWNRTGWTSNYEMIRRYLQIKQYIPLLESPEVEELRMNPNQEAGVEE